MNDTHQVLAYVDDVSLIGDIRTTEKKSDVLLNACRDIGLTVNTGVMWAFNFSFNFL